jgi:hypothetical protein
MCCRREEDDVLKQVKLRVSGPHEHIDDESAILEISPDLDDKVPSGGAIAMKDLSAQRLLVVADALAKSVSLGRDEREVNAVFDIIEPFATELARNGRPPWKRRSMLKFSPITITAGAGPRAIENPLLCWGPIWSGSMPASRTNTNPGARQTLKRKLDTIVETARTSPI